MRVAIAWVLSVEARRAVRLGAAVAVGLWLLLAAYARAIGAPPWPLVYLGLAATTAGAAVALGPWRPGGWERMGPGRRLAAAGAALPGVVVLLLVEGVLGTLSMEARLNNAAADAARRAGDPGRPPRA